MIIKYYPSPVVTPAAGSRTVLRSPQCPSWLGRPPIVPGKLLPSLGRTQIGILGLGLLAPSSRQAGRDSGRGAQPSALERPSAVKKVLGRILLEEKEQPTEAGPLYQEWYTQNNVSWLGLGQPWDTQMGNLRLGWVLSVKILQT